LAEGLVFLARGNYDLLIVLAASSQPMQEGPEIPRISPDQGGHSMKIRNSASASFLAAAANSMSLDKMSY